MPTTSATPPSPTVDPVVGAVQRRHGLGLPRHAPSRSGQLHPRPVQMVQPAVFAIASQPARAPKTSTTPSFPRIGRPGGPGRGCQRPLGACRQRAGANRAASPSACSRVRGVGLRSVTPRRLRRLAITRRAGPPARDRLRGQSLTRSDYNAFCRNAFRCRRSAAPHPAPPGIPSLSALPRCGAPAFAGTARQWPAPHTVCTVCCPAPQHHSPIIPPNIHATT